tara:strand:+ start:355 stop:1029 length:675 start_codon:yes stop_codon:yes gene_type:complete
MGNDGFRRGVVAEERGYSGSFSSKNSIFQTAFRESLPTFLISTFKTTFWMKKRSGFIGMPNGIEIEFRRKHRYKRVYLRVVSPGCQWVCIDVARVRWSKKMRLMVCPCCMSLSKAIYATGPGRGKWRCDHCIQVPTAIPSGTARRLHRHLVAGRTQPVAAALASGSKPTQMAAMIAMEMAGLRPAQHSVSALQDRIQHSIRRSGRLRVRSSGQLLYVEGKFYVR